MNPRAATNKPFGDFVTIRRMQLGLSQGEAADRIGIAQQTWSNYEAGRVPPYDRVAEIARALELPADFMHNLARPDAGDAPPLTAEEGASLETEMLRRRVLELTELVAKIQSRLDEVEGQLDRPE